MRGLITPAELRANPALVGELRARPQEYIERRFIAPELSFRDAEDGDSGIYKGGGLAIVYNSRSENLGGFVEVIKPGAARDVLARDPDVRALFNHDPNYVLGRTRAGTLRLDERDEGLDYEFDAPDVTYARDLRVLFDRGDVTQSSFAFRVAPDAVEWDEDPDTGLLLRIIHRFSGLYDTSPVTYPAYPAATSGVRAVEPAKTTEVDEDLDSSDASRDDEAHGRLALRERRARLRGRA